MGSAQIADVTGSVSASLAERIMTDADGRIFATPSLTGVSAGLVQTGNFMGYWNGTGFDSFIGKAGVPIIDDEDKVRAILKGKELEWHGKHPQGAKPGSGWYTRVIGGQKLTKTMAGVV